MKKRINYITTHVSFKNNIMLQGLKLKTLAVAILMCWYAFSFLMSELRSQVRSHSSGLSHF